MPSGDPGGAVAGFGDLRPAPMSDPDPHTRRQTLLSWRDTERVPWDVLMLFGGGLALAETITRTGLGTWLGTWIGGLGTLPLPVFVVLVTLVVIAVTEFASNVAAAASFIPVVAGVTVALGLDPLVLTLPAALAATWGFMMPAGTPPNAIAYATGYVRVAQMIRAGIWIDLLGLLVIPLSVAIGVALFLLRGRYPFKGTYPFRTSKSAPVVRSSVPSRSARAARRCRDCARSPSRRARTPAAPSPPPG